MIMLTIEIPDKVEKTLINLIGFLGGRVIAVDSHQPNKIDVIISNPVKTFNQLGPDVFIAKRKTYDYKSLIYGVVLGSNTYRGFHKVDKDKPGAKTAFEHVLDKNKNLIISEFKKITKEKELDDLSNEICKELKSSLKKNIDISQLESFNKLRKPIDIVFEHFVAMGEDFADTKSTLTPFLFLPLDSQMFLSDVVFPHDDLKELNIKRNFTFKDITNRQHYYLIQEYLKNRALKLGFSNRIYFDLIWGDRYKKKSSDIFVV